MNVTAYRFTLADERAILAEAVALGADDAVDTVTRRPDDFRYRMASAIGCHPYDLREVELAWIDEMGGLAYLKAKRAGVAR